MKPIKIRIRKKTLVPTKRAIINQFRSDWILVGVIDYIESLDFFSRIRTDAQFALWLKQTYGNGIYSMIAWKKGREGFFSFLTVECMDERFKRLQKKETQEQKEARELQCESNRLKRQLKGDGLDDEQKKEIQNQMQDINSDLSLNKEIISLDSKAVGCSPYLRSTLPLFKEHEYSIPEDVITAQKQKEEEYNLW